MLNILYEDNHVIVVVKPPNILSQADSTGDIDMLTIIKKYIKEKYNKKGNVYLGLVHRLDRPVGGVMVFAKSSKAASRLSNMIKERNISKRYLAVLNGILKDKEGSFEDYLVKKDDGNTEVTTKGKGKYSKLSYKVLEEKNNLSLVDIVLETGRHHQIRVEFSSRGYPLYSDQRYGRKEKGDIALWAYELEFVHPTLKETMKFTAYPYKINSIWNTFDYIKSNK